MFACGCGPRDAPVQSAARTFGLEPLTTVKDAGSDWKSWWFQRYDLPTMITRADKEISHAAVVDHFEKLVLDPGRLTLAETCRVRLYFIGEGSGYNNALGVNLKGIGIKEGEPRLLFPLVNCNILLDAAAAAVKRDKGRWKPSQVSPRTPEAPIHPGDFVDLGRLPAGTTLNFFLSVPNEGPYTYTAYPAMNPDEKAHMVAIAVENTPFLLVGYEDMFNTGDADYEDCVFAVQLSAFNVQSLIGQIDPWRRIKQMTVLAIILTMVIGGPAGTVIFIRRRRLLRKRAARDAARKLAAGPKPLEAIAIIDEMKKGAKTPLERDEWNMIEMDACRRARDLAHLAQLHAEAPHLFDRNEPAAVEVARVCVETERSDTYAAVRGAWQTDAVSPEWSLLDADALAKEGKPHEAAAALEKNPLPASHEARRLARLACLRIREDPQAAHGLLTEANRLAPDDAEVALYRGLTLEIDGRPGEAQPALEEALRRDPLNPFHRDKFAEFLRRHGQVPQAVAVWAEGLAPPSMDFLWAKTLFWTRLVETPAIGWKTWPPPPGDLRPLIDFLLSLPPQVFWDQSAFTPIAERAPGLTTRQEVFWLRLLEALRTGREVEALWLLTFQSFDRRSWNHPLETALVRILFYRRSGFLSFSASAAQQEAPDAEGSHSFFAEIDHAARTPGARLAEATERLLLGPHAFAAACLAAAWREAAARMIDPAALSGDLPDWFLTSATSLHPEDASRK